MVKSDGQSQQVSTVDPAGVVLDLLSAAADLTLVVGPRVWSKRLSSTPQSSLVALATGWEGRPLQSLFAEEAGPS